MTELITWLRAQLDEDERVAQRAGAYHPTWTYDRETFTVSSGGWSIAARKADHSPINDVDGEHIVHNDPARVLAEVDAKRRILDLHDGDHECSTFRRGVDFEGKPYEEIDNCTWVVGVCSTVKLLALPYAGLPGYRSEWAP